MLMLYFWALDTWPVRAVARLKSWFDELADFIAEVREFGGWLGNRSDDK